MCDHVGACHLVCSCVSHETMIIVHVSVGGTLALHACPSVSRSSLARRWGHVDTTSVEWPIQSKMQVNLAGGKNPVRQMGSLNRVVV